MPPTFEPESKRPIEPARKPKQGSATTRGTAGVRQRLRGMGYEEGRALLSPGGSDSDTPSESVLGPAADTTPPGGTTPVEPGGVSSIPPEQRRLVRAGSQGKEVAYAQERLNAHGAQPLLAVDEMFGPLTRKALLDYQNSHALKADAVVGPRTWASLDGPADVGKSQGAGTGGGAGGPGSTVLLYDNAVHPLNPPAPGTKKDVPIAEIKSKQGTKSPELGKTIKVDGAAAGSEAEVHLYNVIAQLGARSQWGSESDMVTQIGYAPRGGGPAPRGRVTLRIDGAGNATASLVGSGPATVAATFKDIATGKAGLKTNFGFSFVEDGDATWTLDELNKIQAALSRLSGKEKAALSGVVLKRMHSIERGGQALSGLYETSQKFSDDKKAATSAATLSLADAAFSSDLSNFIGDQTDAAPASFQTILHEVGHAVEGAEEFRTTAARNEAQADVNRKIEPFNAQVAKAAPLFGALNTAHNAANQKAAKYPKAQQGASAAYKGAMRQATNTIEAFSNNRSGGNIATMEATANTAIANRDTQRVALDKASSSKHPALTDYSAVETRQGDLMAVAKREQAALGVVEAAREKLRAAETAVAATKSGSRTVRLKAFADLVAKEKIPPLTKYAQNETKKKASTGIAEFYAEAFSLFHADPTYLKSQAPKLFDFFDKGEHVK